MNKLEYYNVLCFSFLSRFIYPCGMEAPVILVCFASCQFGNSGNHNERLLGLLRPELR